MATQKHLNCERESCPLLAVECSPHVFLICLKFLTCHKWALLTAFHWILESTDGYSISILDRDLVILITCYVSSNARGEDRTYRDERYCFLRNGKMES